MFGLLVRWETSSEARDSRRRHHHLHAALERRNAIGEDQPDPCRLHTSGKPTTPASGRTTPTRLTHRGDRASREASDAGRGKEGNGAQAQVEQFGG